MKKLVFLLAIVVLAGGAWYMQKTSVGGDSFSRAMEIMKNLKSSALTTDQISTLEDEYQKTLILIPQLNGYITTDETALNTLITSINKPALTAIKTTIVTKAKTNRNSNLDGEIDSLISSLGLTADQVTNIKTIAGRLNRTSRSLSLREQYVDPTNSDPASPSYGFIRSGLCASGSPQAYDLYTAATVSPYFVTSTASPTFAAKADACGTGANLDKLTEYKCVEGQFRTDTTENYKKTTTCSFGCKTGVCLKGEINPATVTSDAAGTTVLGDVKSDQPFYLKINANRAADTTTPLTVEVSSTAFNSPAKCTLATKTATFSTVGQNMVLGPVVCTANATFNFSLKDGASNGTEIDTASTSVSIGANGMKELVVIPPSTTTTPITIGAVTPFTVRAIGTNGFPYNKFTSPVVLIVTGDSGAKNLDNKVIGTATGGNTEETFNVTFSKAGTFTVEARGGTYISAPITVTVVGVTATATTTLAPTTSVPTVTITNGGSGYTTVPVVTVTPGDACTTAPTATATVAGGAVTGITLTGGNCISAPAISIAAPQ